MMNTLPDLPKRNGSTSISDAQILQPTGAVPLSASNTIAALEYKIERMQAERNAERFFWLFGVVILAYGLFAVTLPWYSSTAILLLSLVLLIGCAQYWGVPWVVPYLSRCFDRLSQEKNKNQKEPSPDEHILQ